jgi:hypothetical protein
MAEHVRTNRKIAYLAMTVWLALALTYGGGCKKKEQPKDTQQAVAPQKSEHIAAPEKVETTDTSGKIGLRILYAGLLDTDRAKDFTDFLAKHFKEVGTTDYNGFRDDRAAGFDVVIIDHDGADTEAPRPSISRQYSRATVTMGVPGGDICSGLSLKTGYL